MNCRSISTNSTGLTKSLRTAISHTSSIAFCHRALAWTIAVWLLAVALPASAQDDAKKEPIAENKTLLTDDDWPIHITYLNRAPGPTTPVVVLLHMQGSNRQVYENGLAEKLAGGEFAVITVDLRKHGESKSRGGALAADDASTDASEFKPIDYQLMVAEDLETVKKFIFSEHQSQNLNMAKMGIVAAEMSATIAVNYAAADWLKKPYDDAPTLAASTPRGQDIKAMALLSPAATVPGLQTFKPLKVLADPRIPMALMIGIGSGDSLDKGDAKKMYQLVAGNSRNKDRTYMQTYQFKLRGTDLLGKKLLVEEHITAFFTKHLKEIDLEWTDRRPRYDRDKKKR